MIVNLKGTWGSRAMISPQLSINGQPVPVKWGRNEITVFPGQLQVEVTATYMWTYGRATDTIPVAPNSRVEVYYSAPFFTFLSGRIGPVPQPQRGKIALWVVFVVAALLIVFIIVAAVTSPQ